MRLYRSESTYYRSKPSHTPVYFIETNPQPTEKSYVAISEMALIHDFEYLIRCVNEWFCFRYAPVESRMAQNKLNWNKHKKPPFKKRATAHRGVIPHFVIKLSQSQTLAMHILRF